jgi:hypothetical protein
MNGEQYEQPKDSGSCDSTYDANSSYDHQGSGKSEK